MIILSHRGLWQEPAEKNTAEAFRRSFTAGFGTETDVRDCHGELVISHDMPAGSEMPLSDFLSLLADHPPLTLALNIKSDGLADQLKQTLSSHPHIDWFVFDMSVPDQRAHLQAGNPVFTRLSEVEQTPIWLDQAKGIWLDAFSGNWFNNTLIENLLRQDKRVCIVSPELHGRNPLPLWTQLSELPPHPNLMLCTDQAPAARDFFKEHT